MSRANISVPLDRLRHLEISGIPTRRQVGLVHAAMKSLNLEVGLDEVTRRELGDTTKAAIRALQERRGVPVTGEISAESIALLKSEVEHQARVGSRSRIQKLHDLLSRVGIEVDPAEVNARRFGPVTEAALRRYRAAANLGDNGRADDAVVARLRTDALTQRFSSKTQVAALHRRLTHAARVAKIDLGINPAELKAKQLGPTTIKALQRKYKLPETGTLDPATLERMASVAAGRPAPVTLLKARGAKEVAAVKRVLRLNKTGTPVADLQHTLAFLGYNVAKAEFDAKKFGKTTREAVLAYQRKKNLPGTGHVERATLRALNADVAAVNPRDVEALHPYRLRGSVRNEVWAGMAGVRVQAWEKTLRGPGTMLAERTTDAGGFYDLPYTPPADPVSHQPKQPFHLLIKFIANNQEIGSKVVFNPTLIAWVNFTKGDQPYRGTSEYDARLAAVGKALGAVALADVVEDDQRQEVSHLAVNTGLSQDDVMRLILADRAARSLADPAVPAAVFYAFVRQNLPPNLPGELLAGTQEWSLIDQLVENTVNGTVFMEADLQGQALDNAAAENLIPIAVLANKAAVLASLDANRKQFALDKPVLAGNGNLQSLLTAAQLPPDKHLAVAVTFLKNRGLGESFWADVAARPADFGGEAAVRNLRTTVEVGAVAKNHVPTLQFLKAKIDAGGGGPGPAMPQLKSSRDLAKVTRAEWADLINANGGAVPPSTDGNTPAEKVGVYAATLQAQAERMFPSVAFAAAVTRSNAHALQNAGAVQTLIDDHPDLDLRTTNLDKFVADKALNVPDATMAEARVMQRVNRLAPTADSGTALLEKRFHSSEQVLSLGKDNFIKAVAGALDERTAATVYGYAHFQYAKVLARLTDFRSELYRVGPRAVVDYTYTTDEQQQLLGQLPNLETLFGPADFCDTRHCDSVYGPAAYLADVLRFLEAHPAEQVNANANARDVLFQRRPDIGNIKLNCPNTETPLPYVDLVCEILENAVAAPAANPNFSFQTTRSPAELRAFPEHVRDAAYDVIKLADFPITGLFNLWQEESRVMLAHLGVPRWQLMEAFQAAPATPQGDPPDASIAGEFFGMSTREVELTTTSDETAARQTALWGFDATRASIPVQEFLDHANVSYRELLELVQVEWIHPASAADRIQINRPFETAGIASQTLTKLTPAAFDMMHRFLRLWRRSGRPMWDLDLAVRAPRLGNGQIDPAALVALKGLRQVQDRLALPAEAALAMYGPINTAERSQPDDLNKKVQPLYATLFQNPGVSAPVNPAFTLPLDATKDLADHRPTLLSALAVTEAELTLLLARTDGKLTLDNLTLLLNFTNLARGLKLPVTDVLTIFLLARGSFDDPFASPKATLDFVERAEWVKASGSDVGEVDYLLNTRPDSPYGPREDVITEWIESLREGLRSNAAAGNAAGQVKSMMASNFSLTDEQADLLLTNLKNGQMLVDLSALHPLTDVDAGGAYVTPVTPASFPAMYGAFRFLHKAATLVRRHKLADPADLEWLLTKPTAYNGLDFNALPVDAAPTAALFPKWLNLVKWLHLKSLYKAPEGVTLRSVFDKAAAANAAAVADVRADVAKLTAWKASDLAAVDGNDKATYSTPEGLLRLVKRFRQLKRLGVDAFLALGWADRDGDAAGEQATRARQVRDAVKSKYDYPGWLSKVTPLADELRERKRDALINYLVERSLRDEPASVHVNGKDYANPKRWKNADALLNYFLIDVQMCSCQATSRIKQAMSSVQMFVQRCFLNLEQPDVEVSREERQDATSVNSWRQWKWMKSYRVWEANRKVFLYPENWIEPELRDDKSSFFEELESELLQNEATDENVEAAFSHYVEKVNEVARLEVCGVYHEVDDDNPSDNLPPTTDVLHVIGRTRAGPRVYYYRQFDLSYRRWTAWSRVEVDITGDHVIPVVYNRTLHLFWLVFMEKPIKVKKQPPAKAAPANATSTDTPDPPNQYEIQLAWSRHKGDGWTPKQVSRQKLVHPWPRPTASYHFKPRYKSRENLLWLDLYISTSPDFNNYKFWDPFANAKRNLTSQRFDEARRPWHSSSFVFDGGVVDLKLKPLKGQYRVVDGAGNLSDDLSASDSYQYVHDNFGEAGRAVARMSGRYEIAPQLVLPPGMHYRNTHLANNTVIPKAALNVVERNATRTLLDHAIPPFEMAFSQDHVWFDTGAWGPSPFFYQDNYRAFFVKPDWQTVWVDSATTAQDLIYVFFPFYHPYAALFRRELNRAGVDGLLNRKIQASPQTLFPGNNFDFAGYGPRAGTAAADATAQRDVVDFSQSGAFAIYNWELFFHAPLMIACRLTQNQRFEEAMRWFHFIFDPTSTEALSAPQRFWVTKPFFDQNAEEYRRQRIQKLLSDIDENQELDEVRAWKNNPFKPHLVARYRPVAYQRAVVMKYVNNLLAWADQLFRRDTMEAINEATTLYVLAHELLGPRPEKVPAAERTDKTYNELVADGALDPFGNKRVDVVLENFTPHPHWVTPGSEANEPLPHLNILYFRIPHNDQLLSYWDVVADRLFKIRHCMNIQGAVRQLPLFEPPIDPALLVKAAAGGVDLGSILSATAAPASQYRFRTLSAKAMEFVGEVRQLGEKLLSALEKKDAEALANLRSVHEVTLLKAATDLRKQRIKELEKAQLGLEQAKLLAEEKKGYYEGRDLLSPWETIALGLHGTSFLAEAGIAVGYILAGGLGFIPSFVAGASGFGGSPIATVKLPDGVSFSAAAEAAVKTLSAIATAAEKAGNIASTLGSYQRRMDDWEFQGRLAAIESKQVDAQIQAAQIQQAVAEKELENHELQIEQAQAVDEYLRSKYTNGQLYDWMIRQLSTVYFQAYQLAYDMAKRAERSFQFELAQPEASFVQFGYWDGLKKGLLAGERLANDVRRMDAAYCDANTRTLELTKHVSLAQFMPLSLVALRQTGRCAVKLPEWLFDLDRPGETNRCVRGVTLTIPCVVGPYTNVNCTLTLTRNVVRLKDSGAAYGDPLLDVNDDRFASNPVPVSSVATSHGQNDAGLFEFGFQDERYLPFEGAGAVSEWTIEMPPENNQFDLSTVSDVILHVSYTAKPGSAALAGLARTNLEAVLPASGIRLLPLKQEFGTAWYRFLNPDADSEQTLALTLTPEHLPFYARARSAGKTVKLTRIDLFAESDYEDQFKVRLRLPGQSAVQATEELMPRDPTPSGVHHMQKAVIAAGTPVLGDWQVSIRRTDAADYRSLQPDELQALYLVIQFKIA